MKAILKKGAIKFDKDISGYQELADEIECEAEIEKDSIHLKIPFQQKINKDALRILFETLDESPVKCNIDTLVKSLEIEDQ